MYSYIFSCCKECQNFLFRHREYITCTNTGNSKDLITGIWIVISIVYWQYKTLVAVIFLFTYLYFQCKLCRYCSTLLVIKLNLNKLTNSSNIAPTFIKIAPTLIKIAPINKWKEEIKMILPPMFHICFH